jgi:chemotaxis protein methyltransferase CheR
MKTKNAYPEISTVRYTELCNLVKMTLGLYFPIQKRDSLLKGILEFSSEIKARSLDECISYIMESRDSQKMCERLASHLTVGETYFYRHSQQFDFLKENLLTNLYLEKRKAMGKKYLRLWSSACCTGEEAYSIAMMIDEKSYNFSDWDIRITGSDLNPIYLKKAKVAEYGDWSFRENRKNIIAGKYFTEGSKGKKLLAPRIKSMVNFIYHNLATDEYPAMFNGTNGLDVIFCRNTLIYFELPTVNKVIKKLYNCLVEGGIFVVAPAEAPLVSATGLFESIRYGNVFLFRKKMLDEVKPAAGKSKLKKPALTKSRPADKKTAKKSKAQILKQKVEPTKKTVPFIKIQSHFKKGEYNTVIRILDNKFLSWNFTVPLADNIRKEMIMLIKSYANVGKLKEADYWSRTAISKDKLIPEFYYIRATILQELGKEDEMAKTLRKAIYIDNTYIPALFLFGMLLRRQNKNIQAKNKFNRTLELLKPMDNDVVLEEADGLTVNRLKTIIDSMLI